MPQLFLHIGTQKTGTSSIQSALAANRGLLSQHGFCYPETEPDDDNKVSHYDAFRGFFSPHAHQIELTERFISRVSQSPQNLVLSAECLSCWPARKPYEKPMEVWRRKAPIVEKIRAVFPNHDATVIVFVRNETDFLRSLYGQFLKFNKAAEGDESWRQFNAENGHLIFYGAEVNCWRKHFEEVRVINYDRIASSVETFCRIVGLPMLDDRRENVSQCLAAS